MQQLFTGGPVHIKHVFIGVPKFQTGFHVSKRSPRHSKHLPGNRVEILETPVKTIKHIFTGVPKISNEFSLEIKSEDESKSLKNEVQSLTGFPFSISLL